LLDYLAARQVRARAFDTEVPRGTLKRFHPKEADVVDVTHVPDQMKIFDTLHSAEVLVTLIDVRSGLLSPTLRVCATSDSSMQRRRISSRSRSFTFSDPQSLRLTRSRKPPPSSVMPAISW
jgi:hypothetical protein